MRKQSLVAIVTAVTLGLVPGAGRADTTPSQANRLAPLVNGVFDGWKAADVVCLGEGHGRLNDSDLRLAVVRDPRFAKSTNVVIVEWANGIHQNQLDRFALDGVAMTRAELAPVWRDAVGAETFELPIYEEFLRAVQEANKGLPRASRVRLIAGDTAIDWRKIRTVEDLLPYMTNGMINRGGNIRTIVTEQVLKPKLRALAIYGSGHCRRIGMGFPGELEPDYPGRFWSIASFAQEGPLHQRGKEVFGLGDQPAFVLVRGTQWAERRAEGLFGMDRGNTIGQMVDAVVYYGATGDRIATGDRTALEREYGAELARRTQLFNEARKRRGTVPGFTGWPGSLPASNGR
jgi:hypothetical protein